MERTLKHEVLAHLREVSEVIGFGQGASLDNLVEALDEDRDRLDDALRALKQRRYVDQHKDGEWWVTGPGWDALETLAFFAL